MVDEDDYLQKLALSFAHLPIDQVFVALVAQQLSLPRLLISIANSAVTKHYEPIATPI